MLSWKIHVLCTFWFFHLIFLFDPSSSRLVNSIVCNILLNYCHQAFGQPHNPQCQNRLLHWFSITQRSHFLTEVVCTTSSACFLQPGGVCVCVLPDVRILSSHQPARTCSDLLIIASRWVQYFTYRGTRWRDWFVLRMWLGFLFSFWKWTRSRAECSVNRFIRVVAFFFSMIPYHASVFRFKETRLHIESVLCRKKLV